MNPKPDKTIPALYGGILMGVISAIPFLNFINCLCCAGIMLGGFLAVYFYKNNFTPDSPPMTSGDCMSLGALAGVFGAIVGAILGMFFLTIFGNIAGEFMMNFLKNMDLNVPPGTWEKAEEDMRGGGIMKQEMMGIIFSLILDPLFGLLGGLIGYSVFKPKPQFPPPPMMPPPMWQPPPPPPEQPTMPS